MPRALEFLRGRFACRKDREREIAPAFACGARVVAIDGNFDSLLIVRALGIAVISQS